MIVLALLLATSAQPAAKLILVGQPPTVINYATMARCLAAKYAILRQAAERAASDRKATGIIALTGPIVYCVPA